jgi:transcriptional regulator with XRE-family HTH domain
MPRQDKPAKDAAARIRAVRNYIDITQHELADRIGVSLATMKRIESGARPISSDELLAIGEACHAPPDFMLHGYDAITSAGASDIPMDCLRRFGDLDARMAEVEAQVRRLYTDDGS